MWPASSRAGVRVLDVLVREDADGTDGPDTPQQALPPPPPNTVVKAHVPRGAPPAPAERATQPATALPPLPTTRPTTVEPIPSADALAAAQKQLWKQFAAEYDHRTPSERKALGIKLLTLGLKPETDPATRLALFHEARDLAADARDPALALRAAEAAGWFFPDGDIDEKVKALSAASWPLEDENAAHWLTDAWLKIGDDAAAAQAFDSAMQAAEKAERVAQRWDDETLTRQVDAHTKRLREARDLFARLQAAQKTLASQPDDPQANLVVGTDLCAAKGDWEKGLAMLVKGSDPVLKGIAQKDLANPAEAGAKVNLVDAWAGASAGKPVAVRDAFQHRAAHWYQSAMQSVAEADKSALRRRMLSLSSASVFDAAGAALSDNTTRHSRMLGGPGGGAFQELPNQPAVLVGVQITVGNLYGNPCIHSLLPIYQTATAKLEGSIHATPAGNPTRAEAKPGYAVGALVAKTGLAVDGFKLVFMRIHGSTLDPNDKYESPWLGARGGSEETTLGGDGKPIIGLQGRAGDGIDAIGIVQLP